MRTGAAGGPAAGKAPEAAGAQTGHGSRSASAAPGARAAAASIDGEPSAAPAQSAKKRQALMSAVAHILVGACNPVPRAPALEAPVKVSPSVPIAVPAATTAVALAGGSAIQAAQPALRSDGGAAAGGFELEVDDDDDDIDIMGTPMPGATEWLLGSRTS